MTMRETAIALQAALADAHADHRRIRELAGELAGRTRRLSHMLGEPDWGAGMLEDIAELVGPDPNTGEEPRWRRH